MDVAFWKEMLEFFSFFFHLDSLPQQNIKRYHLAARFPQTSLNVYIL